jgi:two-component system, OmpR family, response regulator
MDPSTKSDLLPDPGAAGVPAHILVVDDDAQIRQMIADYLGEYDFRVTGAADGQAMRKVLAAAVVDLIVLDLRLPAEDGMSIARALRADSSIPIIILTGRKDDVDRIMGLELGADDYLTKPVNLRELLARIRTVLRRAHAHAPEQHEAEKLRAYRFAGWELDLRTRKLTAPSGKMVELTNAEFGLLTAFLNAPQRILSRDRLLELSKGYDDEVFDRSIDVQILRLRRKIEVDPSRPALIKTERGAGYFFDAAVSKL